MLRLIHRTNQTAHISLQCLSISNSVETKSTGCALFFLARPASVTSKFFASLPSGASLRRSVWRSVVRLSAAGEGVFTDWAGGPQPLFLRNVIFFSRFCFFVQKQMLTRESFSQTRRVAGLTKGQQTDSLFAPTPDLGLSPSLPPRLSRDSLNRVADPPPRRFGIIRSGRFFSEEPRFGPRSWLRRDLFAGNRGPVGCKEIGRRFAPSALRS